MTYREKANLYFWPELNGKCRSGWVLHHKDPSWKTENPKRYYRWNIEDLIPMTRSNHVKWHAENDVEWQKKKSSLETRQKISEHHADISGEKNPMYSKHFSAESKNKMRKSKLGRHWYNNGVINILERECPSGFVKGRLNLYK